MTANSNQQRFKLNYVNPQEHASAAECNNHKIQDRYCAIYYHLPYDRLTCKKVMYLFYSATAKPNYF